MPTCVCVYTNLDTQGCCVPACCWGTERLMSTSTGAVESGDPMSLVCQHCFLSGPSLDDSGVGGSGY